MASLIRLMQVLTCATSLPSRSTVQDLSLMPDPPIPGENQTLSVQYDLGGNAPVIGGTAKYAYTFNYIPMSPDIVDLCSQTQCPIELGTHTETSSFPFPTDLHGLIDLKLTWTDQDDTPIWCVEMKYQVSFNDTTDDTEYDASDENSTDTDKDTLDASHPTTFATKALTQYLRGSTVDRT